MKIKVRFWIFVAVIFLFFILYQAGFGIRSGIRIGYKSSAWGSKMTASFILLSGTKTKGINLKRGETITFSYELEQKKGELAATLTNPRGETVIDFEPGTKGEKTAQIEVDGRHSLTIRGKEARGGYSFTWSIARE